MEKASSYEKAVAYVREFAEARMVANAKAMLASTNKSLGDIDENLEAEVIDLMEEYGAEHGLAEGWWKYEGTTEDIVRQL